MQTIINWFNNLSRNAKIAILVAVAVFTPVVGIVFTVVFGAIGGAFTVLGFVLSFVNWGVATLLILAFGGYKAIKFIKNNSTTSNNIITKDIHDPFL